MERVGGKQWTPRLLAVAVAFALAVSCTPETTDLREPRGPSESARPTAANRNPLGPRMLVVRGVTVTFSGGTGETIESAVVIHAPNEEVGVAAEYDYVSAIYGRPHIDWERPFQALVEQGGRKFDQLAVIDLSDNSHHSFYFDITEFFGK
jgi:hypothetical protein